MEENSILIYKEDGICYNVLNQFAEEMKKSLARLGVQVEIFDSRKQELSELVNYAGRDFKAILGFQSGLLDIYLK